MLWLDTTKGQVDALGGAQVWAVSAATTTTVTKQWIALSMVNQKTWKTMIVQCAVRLKSGDKLLLEMTRWIQRQIIGCQARILRYKDDLPDRFLHLQATTRPTSPIMDQVYNTLAAHRQACDLVVRYLRNIP